MIFQLNDFYFLDKQFQLPHVLNYCLLDPINQFDVILQRTLIRGHYLFIRLARLDQAWDHRGIHMRCRLMMVYIRHKPLIMVVVGGYLWVGKREMRPPRLGLLAHQSL